jgi:hypothetical protein
LATESVRPKACARSRAATITSVRRT